MAWTEAQAGAAADFIGTLVKEIQFDGGYDVVSNEAETRAAIERRRAEGLELAAISNAGMPVGSLRLTFLPAECFTGSGDPNEPVDGYDIESGRAKMSIDEFLDCRDTSK